MNEPNLEKQLNQARSLLSSYLDGEVTSTERDLVERMLQQTPALQTELGEMQQTQQLLRQLPRVPAPRPFTLRAEDVGLAETPATRPWWQLWRQPLWGGIAALIAVLVIGVLFSNGITQGLPGSELAMAPESAPQSEMATVAVEADRAAPAPEATNLPDVQQAEIAPMAAEAMPMAEDIAEAPPEAAALESDETMTTANEAENENGAENEMVAARLAVTEDTTTGNQADTGTDAEAATAAEAAPAPIVGARQAEPAAEIEEAVPAATATPSLQTPPADQQAQVEATALFAPTPTAVPLNPETEAALLQRNRLLVTMSVIATIAVFLVLIFLVRHKTPPH